MDTLNSIKFPQIQQNVLKNQPNNLGLEKSTKLKIEQSTKSPKNPGFHAAVSSHGFPGPWGWQRGFAPRCAAHPVVLKPGGDMAS